MEKNLYLYGITEHEVEVLSCEQLANENFKVVLNQTPFHPQGGGQPSDVGTIAESEVIHVAFENGNIIHECKQAIPLGHVSAKVNQQQRHLHSRLHSAGHLIGHIVEAYGWQPTKAQHWPSDAKVQFIATENNEEIDSLHLKHLLKQAIEADRPAKITINNTGFREIAFGHFNAYPCGGTHVQSLVEIGEIEIQKIEIKKGKLTIRYGLALGHAG